MGKNLNVHKEARRWFRRLKPRDFLILEVFFQKGEATAQMVYNELREADATIYNRRINCFLKEKELLKYVRTKTGKRGKPQKFYQLTLKGLIAVLANDVVSIKDVMEKTKHTFVQELSFPVPQKLIEDLWNKAFYNWLEAQAKARVNLTEVENADIAISFVQTLSFGVPKIFSSLNHTTISELANFFPKLLQHIPISEKYFIGHCELILRLNLPLVDFKEIEKPFTRYLHQNGWSQAKVLLENAVKAKSQAKYWLRCKHFIATQNGARKCGIGGDCVYTNFLLCPKVKESLEKALKP